jgi:hypothetical protein
MNLMLGMPSPTAVRLAQGPRLHDPIKYWYTVPLCELSRYVSWRRSSALRTLPLGVRGNSLRITLFRCLLLRAAVCSEMCDDRIEGQAGAGLRDNASTNSLAVLQVPHTDDGHFEHWLPRLHSAKI